ncbi:DNA polymerase I [Buchnera aphidicola (Pterocallis alni)]|uniref:5'-3' exonuclease n=1 Tax=Buchnera aphidicola TaxID=9 RepID=UPI003464CF4B
MNNKKIIILLDGYSYIYRFYFVALKNQNIENTIYLFFYTIQNILKTYLPKKFIVIFDSKEKNFRTKIFQKYKKNRKKIPFELIQIINTIYKILIHLGIPTLCIPNVEADDVIATISKLAEKNGDITLIGTIDKDLTQLVNKNIYILNKNHYNISSSVDIKKKYGVHPKYIIDLFALIGDQSDNIPGVKGIGKKTAIKLILSIGSINQIYKNLKKIHTLPLKGKKNILKKLIEGKNMAILSYKLIKLKINVDIKKKYTEITFQKNNNYLKPYNIKYFKMMHNIYYLIQNICKYHKI